MEPKTDWNAHIAAWKGSGLSKAEYCRQNRIKIFTFYQKTANKKSPQNNKFIKLPFPGFPQQPGYSADPDFEFHLEIPFQFRLRINIRIGRGRA